MSNSLVKYDCAVIGGGLAGLCLSIQLAKSGFRVVLFEKHRYPFHKVCGEYVSNESYGFLLRLGLKLDEWELPQINRLAISSEKGFTLNARLDLGGFGISRYKLDHELVKLAKEHGVNVLDDTKVHSITGNSVGTSRGDFSAKAVVGAFGRSVPAFAKQQSAKPSDHVGVKYHIRINRPPNQIGLHNFSGGYCGISRIEDNQWCLCYMTHTSQLKASGNSIARMEAKVLRKNPHLEKIFSEAEFVFPEPVTVSNIRFAARQLTDDNLLYVGDAAGSISPLTGNGMSMSLYASSMLSALLKQFIRGEVSRAQLSDIYTKAWNSHFLSRIRRSRHLQYLFGSRHLSDFALRALDPFEGVKKRLIRSTHGVPF
jgi:menaquinone-9 beta-reductase